MPLKKDATRQFNVPYVILKAKNIIDPGKRQTAWNKARPIAPQTKHPMRKLFHLTGRAWSFITAHMEGQHFVLNHGGKVHLRQCVALGCGGGEPLGGEGEVGGPVAELVAAVVEAREDEHRLRVGVLRRAAELQHRVP